jgi:hypothetical protein
LPTYNGAQQLLFQQHEVLRLFFYFSTQNLLACKDYEYIDLVPGMNKFSGVVDIMHMELESKLLNYLRRGKKNEKAWLT